MFLLHLNRLQICSAMMVYGNQIVSDELSSLYGGSHANGFGPEVKRRILMGTYALSAGYYDAYYKQSQQVRTVVQKSFKAALDSHDIIISPAASSAAYKIGNYQFTHFVFNSKKVSFPYYYVKVPVHRS
ncbi:putative glutaminyl-tRNA synthase (glutamine-hydrolyzing) [Helianthus anomalus]